MAVCVIFVMRRGVIMAKKQYDKMPDLYGALVLIFPPDTLDHRIKEILHEDFKCDIFKECIEVRYREVKWFSGWEIDDLLTKLFGLCNFDIIRSAQKNLAAKVLVDISFVHRETYPALIFEGENMKRIHELQADISIDPY